MIDIMTDLRVIASALKRIDGASYRSVSFVTVGADLPESAFERISVLDGARVKEVVYDGGAQAHYVIVSATIVVNGTEFKTQWDRLATADEARLLAGKPNHRLSEEVILNGVAQDRS